MMGVMGMQGMGMYGNPYMLQQNPYMGYWNMPYGGMQGGMQGGEMAQNNMGMGMPCIY